MNELKIIETHDGSHSLLNEALNETYHSTHGAIQESKHVFIKNGLRYWLEDGEGKTLSIFEVGFGTGLNAFLTLNEMFDRSIEIQYTAIEAFPVSLELIDHLNYTQRHDFTSVRTLFRQLHLAEWDKPVSITPEFFLQKLEGKLQELNLPEDAFDIVFFDAFAPNKQPEMWEVSVLEKIFKSMRLNSVFVTYCAKGQFKRDLKSVGFKVETLPGPPGKREMVRGLKLIQ